MPYNILKPDQLFDRIKTRCDDTEAEHPPFTLILGSGFSYGIVPTTAQVVREDLPWWKWCQRKDKDGPTPDDFRDRNEARFASLAKEEARRFWGQVARAHGNGPWILGSDGLPTDDGVGEAYRFALSAACAPGLSTPHEVRCYFGDIIRRVGRRLNPAHLFLASIIAEKPRLFGTIFTTNFDPLLQRSLQLVNAPYFVSDRPDTLQHPDDDDVIDAVHVVHAHGSIYRYLLLNSPAEITGYAERNQHKLQEYFRKHAVIIIGFSGWDDAITRALLNVEQFAHNLYWAGRADDPDKGDLTADAKKILQKHYNAFYVPISGSDDLMARMHQRLIGHSLPRLFREPVLFAQDQLKLCDLAGVKLPRNPSPSLTPAPASANVPAANASESAEDLDLGHQIAELLSRLDDAQKFLIGEAPADAASQLAAQVRQRFAEAADLFFSDKHDEALPHLDFVISQSASLSPAERAQARLRRGSIYTVRGWDGDMQRAIDDFKAVIESPDASIEHRASALVNRGIVHAKNRGEGDAQQAIDDFTTVINMQDAPIDDRVRARVNRAVVYVIRTGRKNESDLSDAIAEYSDVIDLPEAPAELRGKALIGRGFAYRWRGRSGDVQKALADFKAVQGMPDVSAEARAQAEKMVRQVDEKTPPAKAPARSSQTRPKHQDDAS